MDVNTSGKRKIIDESKPPRSNSEVMSVRKRKHSRPELKTSDNISLKRSKVAGLRNSTSGYTEEQNNPEKITRLHRRLPSERNWSRSNSRELENDQVLFDPEQLLKHSRSAKRSSLPSSVAETSGMYGSPLINDTALLQSGRNSSSDWRLDLKLVKLEPFESNDQTNGPRRSQRISEASQLPTKPVPEKAKSVHPPRAQPCIGDAPNTEIKYLAEGREGKGRGTPHPSPKQHERRSYNLSARQSPEAEPTASHHNPSPQEAYSPRRLSLIDSMQPSRGEEPKLSNQICAPSALYASTQGEIYAAEPTAVYHYPSPPEARSLSRPSLLDSNIPSSSQEANFSKDDRAKASLQNGSTKRLVYAKASLQDGSTKRLIYADEFEAGKSKVPQERSRVMKQKSKYFKQGPTLSQEKTQLLPVSGCGMRERQNWIGSEDEPAWLIVSTLVLLLLSLLVLFISTPATLASLSPKFGRLYSPPQKISVEALIRAQVLHFNVGRQADPDIAQMLHTFKSPNVALKVLESRVNDFSSNINVLGRLLTSQENSGIARNIKEIEATLSELQSNHNIDGLTWTHTEKGVKQKLTSLQERFNDFETKAEQERARYLTSLENQQREERFASTSAEDQLQKSAKIIAEIERQTLDSMQIQNRFQQIEAPLNSGLAGKDLRSLVNRIKEMILPPFAKQSMTASQSKVWHDIGKLVARADHHLAIGKLDEKGARKIIEDVIKENLGEIVKLPNYAAANLGAKIIEAKALAEEGNSFLQRLHQTLKNTASPSNSPDVLLSTSSRLDHCWAFKGQKGSVTVRLAKWIDPRQISMKNMHPKVALDPSTAPRQFSVYGFESMGVPLFLGNFTYSIKDKPDQVFEIQHSTLITKISKVRFDFLSNYGHPNFTCVYRIGVHGK